jgi:hypothetical protein
MYRCLMLVLLGLWIAGSAFGADAEPSMVVLDEVVVTAGRVVEKVQDQTMSVTVIDAEEIAASPARDLGDLLAEKGIGYIQKNPGALTTVAIRGFRTNAQQSDLLGYSLVLLNGRRAGTGNMAMIMTRDIERELIPCLRNYGISFYAYNPLAGGLLTGKYQSIDDMPDSGRFAERNGYEERYWKKDYFDVLQQLTRTCGELGLTPTQAAMSWLVNHSLLDAEQGDGIILGATRIEHLTDNMAACDQLPLDQSILDIFDQGWEVIKPNCFKYFRP